MATQTAGPTFPSLSLPHRCFFRALSRDHASPFIPTRARGARSSTRRQRPKLTAAPARGGGHVIAASSRPGPAELGWARASLPAELVGARAGAPCGSRRRASCCSPEAVSPPLRGQGWSLLRPSLYLRSTRGGAPCDQKQEPPAGQGRPGRVAASTRSLSAAREKLPAVKRGSSPTTRDVAPHGHGGGSPGGGHGGQLTRFWACCKCMFYVFEMFQ